MMPALRHSSQRAFRICIGTSFDESLHNGSVSHLGSQDQRCESLFVLHIHIRARLNHGSNHLETATIRMTKQEEFCRTYPEHSDRLRAEPVRGWKQYRPVWPRAPTAYLQTRLARSHLFVLGTDLRRHLL